MVPLGVVHRDVDGYGRAEGEANARLIAAAPDLLARLRQARARIAQEIHTFEWRRIVEGKSFAAEIHLVQSMLDDIDEVLARAAV